MSQNVGMGWKPGELNGKQFLILSTQGGIRNEDGSPAALGYHTGHWEVGLLMKAAAEEISSHGGIPFAGYVSDPCDGRSQGTTGMFDSLPYRNDAAMVFRRLIRSPPTRKGVLGVATCDKGLPAMMLALAGMPQLPGVIVPGGVTLPPTDGEDAGKIQTIGARYANGELSLEMASELGCRACATGRRLSVSRDRGNRPGGSRGNGHDGAACRSGTFRAAHLVRDGAPIFACTDQHGVPRD